MLSPRYSWNCGAAKSAADRRRRWGGCPLSSRVRANTTKPRARLSRWLPASAATKTVVDYRPRHDKAALAVTGRKSLPKRCDPIDRRIFSRWPVKKRTCCLLAVATSVVTRAADVVAGGGAVLCGVVATGRPARAIGSNMARGRIIWTRPRTGVPYRRRVPGAVLDRADVCSITGSRSAALLFKIRLTGLPHRDGLAPERCRVHGACPEGTGFAKDRNRWNGIGSHENAAQLGVVSQTLWGDAGGKARKNAECQ